MLGMALSGAIEVWTLGATAVYLAISDGLSRAKGDDAELSEIITCIVQPSDDVLDIGPLTILYFHKLNNKQPQWRFKSYLEFEIDTLHYKYVCKYVYPA